MDFTYLAEKIAKDQIHLVLEHLKEYSSEDYSSTILLIENQFNRLKKNHIKGSISLQDYEVNINKIVGSILEIIEELRVINHSASKIPNSKMIKPLIELNFKKFTPRYKSIYISYEEYPTFQDLLNMIYMILCPFVSPFSYSQEWFLLLDSVPIFHIARIEDLKRKFSKWDKRLLAEIGIIENCTLEVVGVDYLTILMNGTPSKVNISIRIEDLDKIVCIEASDHYTVIHLEQELMRNGFLQIGSSYNFFCNNTNRKILPYEKVKSMPIELIVKGDPK